MIAPEIGYTGTVLMTTSNGILSAGQRGLLSAVLNCIVPAQGNMPAAGDLGIAQFVEMFAAESANRRRLVLEGLVRIELAAAERGGDFSGLSAEAKTDALRAVESSSPVFFQFLMTQTYRGLLHQRIRYRSVELPGAQPAGL